MQYNIYGNISVVLRQHDEASNDLTLPKRNLIKISQNVIGSTCTIKGQSGYSKPKNFRCTLGCLCWKCCCIYPVRFLCYNDANS